jgi:RNA polymerase sigma-B factor
MTIPTTPDVKQQSQILFVEYKKTGDLQVRNQIIELNLGLVRKEVSHWLNKCSENYDDLLQIGYLGLIRAIDRFDIAKGYAFSSFAVPYIRGEIQHYLRDKGYSLRIPRRYLELKSQGNRVVRELRNELNRQPTDAEIAQKLGISFQKWQDVKIAHQNREPVSLDLPTGDQENKSKLQDLVPDQKYQSFQLAQEDKNRINNALLQLEERTRQVLEFVFLQDLTQKETAEKLGVSVVTVSRRIKKGICMMRNIIKQDDLEQGDI